MLRLVAAALTAGLLAAPLAAQSPQSDAARTIIVLDGSGSMWGQIDGRPKLEIAREVLGRVLAEVPEGRELGLMAYGHRRRGDCSDIELIVPPAPGTAAAIARAANAMRFQGRTPLTEAVRQAARDLNFTENPATVVLITDGIETCAADPCALARELAASGVAFTAHVVGFDMTASEGAQVACLARETGGQYLLANDAAGLASALAATVVAAPEAARASGAGAPAAAAPGPWFPGRDPMPGIRIHPTGGVLPGSHAPVGHPAFPADGRPDLCRAICEEAPACFAWRHEGPGTYFVDEARCFHFDAGAEFDWEAHDGFASGLREGHEALIRPLDAATLASLDSPPPPASLSAPAETTVVARIAVGFEGPMGPEDYLDIVDEAQADIGTQRTWAWASAGNPATLIAPAEPGDYRIRYIQDVPGIGRRVLASAPLSVGMAEYSLRAPDRVMAGSRLTVEWQAPTNSGDWIDIAPAGSDDPNAYLTWVYAPEGGEPAELLAPAQAGDHDLRFVVEGPDGRRVQVARPITVTPAEATLDAPDRVEAGAEFRVDWTGPFHIGHWLALTVPGADDGAHDHGWSYLEAPGMPVRLMAPPEPGRLELRFILDVDGPRVIARRAIEVVAPGTLRADTPSPVPATAPAPVRGGTVEPGIDRPGMDIGQTALDLADPLACQALCAGDPDCRAWTYVNPGLQGDRAMCWTKSDVPQGFANDCCTSGVMDDAALPAQPVAEPGPRPAPDPEPDPPAREDARRPDVDAGDLAHACPAEASEPCRYDDPATGIVFMVAPGYGITQPYFYETAGGARSDRPSLDLIRLADGEVIVWINLRQASGVPCVDNGPDRLCLGVTPGFEDQMAMMLVLGSLAGVHAALPEPEVEEGLGGPGSLAGTWLLSVFGDSHPRDGFPLAIIRLTEADDPGTARGTFRSAPDFEGFAGRTGEAALGFDDIGSLRLDLVAEDGPALVLRADAFGPWDWTGELAPAGATGPAPIATRFSRVAEAGEDWRGAPWMQGEPDGMEAAMQMGARALQGMLEGASAEDRATLQILGQMMGAMGGQSANAPGAGAAPSAQMQALDGLPLEGLTADEALMLLVPHLEVTP